MHRRRLFAPGRDRRNDLTAVRARTQALVVAALVAAAVVVRLPGVWSQALWEDEVASARIMRAGDPIAMLRGVVHTETSPPLWYFAEWSLHHAGLPIRDGRLLSVALGAVLVVLVVSLAQRFVRFPLAAAAGVFVAFGSEFVGHGSELRAYELLAALATALGIAVLRAVEQPTRGRLAMLAVIVAAGGLTHFYFAFSVAAAGAWVWFDRENRGVRRRVTLAISVGAVIALTWAPALVRQYHQDRFWWIGSFSPRYVLAVPLRLFTPAFSHPLAGPVLSTLTVLTVAFGVSRLRGSRSGRLVALLAVGPTACAGVVWAAGMHVFDLRNLIGTGGYIAVLLAAAADALPLLPALGAAAAFAAALAATHVDHRPRYDRIATSLVQDGWNGTQPIAVPGDTYLYKAPLEWYLPRQPVLDVGRAAVGFCPTVFVIDPDGRVRRERVHRPLVGVAALRQAVFLVEHGRRSRCVVAITLAHPATVA